MKTFSIKKCIQNEIIIINIIQTLKTLHNILYSFIINCFFFFNNTNKKTLYKYNLRCNRNYK